MTENKLPRKPQNGMPPRSPNRTRSNSPSGSPQNRTPPSVSPQNRTPPSGSPRNGMPSKTASSSGTPPNKGKANVQGYTNNRLALASQKKV
jgi:hypothetical protein